MSTKDKKVENDEYHSKSDTSNPLYVLSNQMLSPSQEIRASEIKRKADEDSAVLAKKKKQNDELPGQSLLTGAQLKKPIAKMRAGLSTSSWNPNVAT